MKYYLVGIKGTGMSALANILVDLGHEVTGVDYDKKYFTEATFNNSIKVESFNNYSLKNDCKYIIGNAYKLHQITKEITDLGLEFYYYPEFIESFFKMKKIGISGSHGKTTTTKFVSQMVDKKICALIGDGTGFGNQKSDYFLFEACEYRNHFLTYNFDYLVVLNIDYDHPDFFKSASEYLYAFQKAALNAKCLIINADDKECSKIVHKNKITFGFDEDSDVVLKLFDDKLFIKFLEDEFELEFNYFGKYMAYNLAASFIVSYLLSCDMDEVTKKVKSLTMPSRRFEEIVLNNGTVLVNDYAHHPTEIKVVLSALRKKYPSKSIVCVYQGHTNTRTSKFCKEYIEALKNADYVYIMPTFSSVRENDVNPYILLDEEPSFLKYERNFIIELLKKHDIIVAFLGAGDVDGEFNFLSKKINY